MLKICHPFHFILASLLGGIVIGTFSPRSSFREDEYYPEEKVFHILMSGISIYKSYQVIQEHINSQELNEANSLEVSDESCSPTLNTLGQIAAPAA